MPRSFLVKTAERETHDVITSVDHHHRRHHQQQQQQLLQGQNNSSFSLMTSFDQANIDDLMTTYGKLYFICVNYYTFQCMIYFIASTCSHLCVTSC